MHLRDLAVEEPYILSVGLLLNMTGIVFLLQFFDREVSIFWGPSIINLLCCIHP